ncbi:MAG: hypothetical protein R6X20_17650 [Phycisphaerae bacterium]
MNLDEQKRALLAEIRPWQNLWDLPSDAPAAKQAGEPPADAPASAANQPQPHPGAFSEARNLLSDRALRLGLDMAASPFSGCSERIQRIGLSGRAFERGKRELQEQGLASILQFGHTRYLVPTRQYYETFGFQPPTLKRQLSRDHTFALRLVHHLLKQDPQTRWLEIEPAVGDQGATADLVRHLSDGSREVWEITLSAGNVARNAAKYLGKGFAHLYFCCRDTQVRDATRTRVRESGLDPDFLARVRYMLFSGLVKRHKRLKGGG